MEELDPFIRFSQAAKLRGVSSRWLSELVKKNDFPVPDRPASKRGEPHLYRTSTVRRALDAFMQKRVA